MLCIEVDRRGHSKPSVQPLPHDIPGDQPHHGLLTIAGQGLSQNPNQPLRTINLFLVKTPTQRHTPSDKVSNIKRQKPNTSSRGHRDKTTREGVGKERLAQWDLAFLRSQQKRDDKIKSTATGVDVSVPRYFPPIHTPSEYYHTTFKHFNKNFDTEYQPRHASPRKKTRHPPCPLPSSFTFNV